jgi:hypothetical protein
MHRAHRTTLAAGHPFRMVVAFAFAALIPQPGWSLLRSPEEAVAGSMRGHPCSPGPSWLVLLGQWKAAELFSAERVIFIRDLGVRPSRYRDLGEAEDRHRDLRLNAEGRE